MHKLRPFLRYSFFIVVLFIVHACANVVAPVGGPKDEDPPVVLRSTPPNYSVYYKGQDVRIFFNEFVELKNLRQNMLISPPLEKDPEVRVRGRSIIMSVEDTLLPNTTYNFFFGESIVDITEGNPIPNFQFVVSTGSYVDSLSVRGQVINARTLQPEEGVFVMLYNQVFDSVPLLKIPVYLSKSNKEGNFVINNMKEGEYLMFALRDKNFNYLYDSVDEEIAFLDSLIRPEYLAPPLPEGPEEEGEDLTGSDGPADGSPERDDEAADDEDIAQDGVEQQEGIRDAGAPDLTRYQLFLFQQKDTIQRVLSSSSARKGNVTIAFRIPVDSVKVQDYREPLEFITEFSAKRDTMSLWFAETQRDSLFLELSHINREPDSIRISLVQRTAARGRGAAARPETESFLNITTPTLTAARRQPFFKKLELLSPTPIAGFDMQEISLFLNDSIEIPNPQFYITGQAMRRMELQKTLAPDSTYLLTLLPGAITDIFGEQNDTLQIRFRVNTPADYGSLLVNLLMPREVHYEEADKEEEDITAEAAPGDEANGEDADEEEATVVAEKEEMAPNQYILQLLNDKWEVIAEKVISGSNVYTFEHLPAASFRLRLIHDRNRNGKWDTGHYLKSIQPEPVFLYPDIVQTRLNWEVEIIWDFPGY